jgi:hypothetical protein
MIGVFRLKQAIISTWKEECEGRGDEKEQRCPQLNMVWLHCDGENDPDRENIGPVRGVKEGYNVVRLLCDGENDPDRENIGPVRGIKEGYNRLQHCVAPLRQRE